MAGFGVPLLQLYTSDPSIPGANPISYIMTDHNRQPLNISYETIDDTARMANGTMRRFITANKKKIAISWNDVPAAEGYNFTADSNLGAAWLKSFYEENVFFPVWIRLTYAEESWRFPNTQSDKTSRYLSTNKTFRRTAQLGTTSSSILPVIPNAYTVASVAYGQFTNGISTASIYTKIPHYMTAATTPEVYISGINQLFNGTWSGNTLAFPSSSVITFQFNGGTGNASATFSINSYYQTGSSATFVVDNTSYLQISSSIQISNVKNTSGSTIAGVWNITGISNSTVFTASTTATLSPTGTGNYGTGTIISTPSAATFAVTSLNPSIIGPTVASDVLKVYMTSFTYDIKKRFTTTDIVDMSIEFTEV